MLTAEVSEFGEGVWVVDADGDLDLASAGRLSDVLETVAGFQPCVVALDLADVPFIDSSAVVTILRAKRLLEASGSRLAILRPHPMPRFFFHRTHLDQRLAVVESLEEAVERSARFLAAVSHGPLL
jgi:anti-anti-sigma factor